MEHGQRYSFRACLDERVFGLRPGPGDLCLRMEYNNQSEEAGTVVWNQDKEPDLAFIAGHKSQIQCLAWSAMEQKLLTGSDDSSIRIWKARSPSWQKDWNCIRSIEGASLPVRCVAWSEDGSCAVGGYDDNVLRIWDVEKEVCRKVFRGHENRIKCVDWKGEYLVSGSNDHTIRIWNAQLFCRNGSRRRRILEN